MKKQLLILVLIMLPMIAHADKSGTCGDNLTWTLVESTGTLTIEGSGAMNDYSSYSSHSAPWYEDRENISTVVVGYGVTNIGDHAFRNCSSLTSITIPGSVTSIGNNAFWNCSSVTTITIPNSVTSIGSNAFLYCSDLKKVIVSDIAAWCGINFRDNPLSYAHYLYSDENTEIKDLVIPNSVRSIADRAFVGCYGLTSVNIGNNVTSIGENAFCNCSGLTSITIPNSVNSISTGAFSNCSGLTSITIPNSVTSIGNSAFSGCIGLTSLNIPKSVTSIGESAFDDCRIESVLTRNSKTACRNAFSVRTYQHAMLYIPEGTWGEAVYDGDWYMFNNIREVAMNKENLSPTKTYILMDINSFGYAVFDGTNSEVKIAKAFYSIDENDLNNCWQVIDKSGVKCLYNIGAKKYAKITSGGKITLTDNETPINITEGKNGLMFGSDALREWGLIKNNNVNVDSQTGITPVSRTYSDSNSTCYLLDGQQTTQPKKGLNIVRMSDGKSKKVVIK